MWNNLFWCRPFKKLEKDQKERGLNAHLDLIRTQLSLNQGYIIYEPQYEQEVYALIREHELNKKKTAEEQEVYRKKALANAALYESDVKETKRYEIESRLNQIKMQVKIEDDENKRKENIIKLKNPKSIWLRKKANH
jgi:hypothetical protein